MSIIISVEHVSKKFVLNHEGSEKYTALRDVISKKAKELVKGHQQTLPSKEEFWALNDVNFTVEAGDRVGIIGRNGAGKSTLLKVISRITEPSKGRITIKGRIASLLEVGTGFHPELTGRENIFLNGAILGMSRSEIRRKFDEIVAFAEVEKFLDTPVKRYSSGMYVRLAFAVAAHLEPEILIVDEVLAVGDAQFQKKCLGKMEDVSKNQGRTVLFVSHNMAVVRALCNKGIFLKNGTIEYQGTHIGAINYYQNSIENTLVDRSNLEGKPIGNDKIKVINFIVEPLSGDVITISSGISFFVKFYNYVEDANIDVTFELRTIDDQIVFHHGKVLTEEGDSKKGIYEVKGSLPPYFLNSLTYKFNLIFGENQRIQLYYADSITKFDVMNEMLGSNGNVLPGLVRPDIKYEVQFSE